MPSPDFPHQLEKEEEPEHCKTDSLISPDAAALAA